MTQQKQSSKDNASSHSTDLVTPKVMEGHQHPLMMQNDSGELSNSLMDRQVPQGSLGLPSVVLVAKRLTNSDASSGRIILPRVAVETNLSFVVAYRHYGMHVRDEWGESHEFVVKSWANGSESRRVFVLEGVGKFLKQHHVGVGDVVGICAQGDDFVVEVNSEEVKQAAMSTGRSSAASTPRAGAEVAPRFSFGRPMHASHNILPVDGGHGGNGKCSRSAKCTKGAGHPGFCSGPKAAQNKSVRDVQNTHAMYSHSDGNSSQMMDFSHHAHQSPPWEVSEDAEEPAYVEQVFVDENAVNTEMQKLPDGLHRLIYVPERVKVVKRLTEYDLVSKRVVLPADQVSRGLLMAEKVDVYTLAAVDESHGWHFSTVRCWKSVTQKCGYYFEDAHGMLGARGAKPGDYFMIYRDSIHAPPKLVVMDGETCAVKKPLNGPDAEIDFQRLPVLLLPYGDHGDLVAGGSSSVKDVRKWHNGQLGGCFKSVCCLLNQDHRGSCVFEAKERGRQGKRGRELAGVEFESNKTPVHRERRRGRFAGQDPLVSLLNLLE